MQRSAKMTVSGGSPMAADLSEHPHHHAHGTNHSHSTVPSDPVLRLKALESLLAEKGLVDSEAIDAWIEAYEQRIGPRRGAEIVARSWVDPEFKRQLLDDATTAIAPFGYLGRESQHIVAVENTPSAHNLVVCTLCSCYPWGLLGLPPRWYKSASYRARAVIDPRGVLHEFGLDLGSDVEVRVWDSTAEIRYLVVPERPMGTSDLAERELANLVTRDSMIGVARVMPARPRP